MATTSKEAMEALHVALATVLTDAVKNGVKEVTKDGEVVTVTAPAAVLNAARQFLKDNGIETVLTPGTPTADLAASLPFAGSEDDEDYMPPRH